MFETPSEQTTLVTNNCLLINLKLTATEFSRAFINHYDTKEQTSPTCSHRESNFVEQEQIVSIQL